MQFLFGELLKTDAARSPHPPHELGKLSKLVSLTQLSKAPLLANVKFTLAKQFLQYLPGQKLPVNKM